MADTSADGFKFTAEEIYRAAVPELARHSLDEAAYKSYFVINADDVTVVFHDKDVPVGSRGIVADNPTLEVQLKKSDLKIIKSYFAR